MRSRFIAFAIFMTRERRSQRGMSLIELMVVVACIGVLSSIAIPSFAKYIRKSKTTEAYVQMRRAYESSRSYMYSESSARGSTNVIAMQFPDAEALTPALNCCLSPGFKCSPNPSDWDTPTWQALAFAMTDPSYYRYEYASTGTLGAGPGSSFTVRAMGDLDCDGSLSTFEMVGELSAAYRDMQGQAAIYADNALE